MGILTADMKRVVEEQRLGFFATVCPICSVVLITIAGCNQNGSLTPAAIADRNSEVVSARNGPAAQPVEFVDITGVTHRPFADPQVRAVVLIFTVPDCPIANSYVPEINRLYDEYASRGVRLFLIQVDPGSSLEQVREHSRQYEIRPPVVCDERHTWVRRVGATHTPEAAILSPQQELQYLGRIDDRFVGLGKQRAQVNSLDLRDALDAYLAGKPIMRQRTEVVGCDIPDIDQGEANR